MIDSIYLLFVSNHEILHLLGENVKVSVNDFIIKAAAIALQVSILKSISIEEEF